MYFWCRSSVRRGDWGIGVVIGEQWLRFESPQQSEMWVRYRRKSKIWGTEPVRYDGPDGLSCINGGQPLKEVIAAQGSTMTSRVLLGRARSHCMKVMAIILLAFKCPRSPEGYT